MLFRLMARFILRRRPCEVWLAGGLIRLGSSRVGWSISSSPGGSLRLRTFDSGRAQPVQSLSRQLVVLVHIFSRVVDSLVSLPSGVGVVEG